MLKLRLWAKNAKQRILEELGNKAWCTPVPLLLVRMELLYQSSETEASPALNHILVSFLENPESHGTITTKLEELNAGLLNID